VGGGWSVIRVRAKDFDLGLARQHEANTKARPYKAKTKDKRANTRQNKDKATRKANTAQGNAKHNICRLLTLNP
jgi:hypothetical protein